MASLLSSLSMRLLCGLSNEELNKLFELPLVEADEEAEVEGPTVGPPCAGLLILG